MGRSGEAVEDGVVCSEMGELKEEVGEVRVVAALRLDFSWREPWECWD